MTMCPISREQNTLRRPISRSTCSNATPITKPGISSGDTRKASSAWRPRKCPCSMAMAHKVPSTSATAVEASATPTDRPTAAPRPALRPMASYQRQDQWPVSRSKTGLSLKDTSAITTSGASMKAAVDGSSNASPHIFQGLAVTSRLRRRGCWAWLADGGGGGGGLGWGGGGKRGAADDEGDGDQQQPPRGGRAGLPVAHEEIGAGHQRGQGLVAVTNQQRRDDIHRNGHRKYKRAAGDPPRQGQRPGDSRKGVPGGGAQRSGGLLQARIDLPRDGEDGQHHERQEDMHGGDGQPAFIEQQFDGFVGQPQRHRCAVDQAVAAQQDGPGEALDDHTDR